MAKLKVKKIGDTIICFTHESKMYKISYGNMDKELKLKTGKRSGKRNITNWYICPIGEHFAKFKSEDKN